MPNSDSTSTMVSGIKWNSSIAVAKMIIGMLFSILLAKWLGLTNWGIFLSTLLVGVTCVQLSNVFFGQSLTYYISKHHNNLKKQKSYTTILLLLKTGFGFVLSLVVFLISPFLANYFHIPDATIYFQITAIFILVSDVFESLIIILYAKKKFKETGIIELISRLLKVFIVYVFILMLGWSVFGALLGMIISLLVGVGGFLWILRDSFTLNPIKINKKEVMRYNFDLSVVNFFRMFLTKTDSFVIGFLFGSVFVGVYGIPLLIISSICIGFSSLMNVLVPSFISFVKDKKRINNAMYKSLYYGLFLVIPICVGVILTAPYSIGFFFGSAYEGAVIPLMILSFLIIEQVLLPPFYAYLIATKKHRVLGKYCGICFFTNLLLNIILIPSLGLIGAAIATISSKILLDILMIKETQRHNIKLNFKKLLKAPIIASLGMAIVLIPLKGFVNDYFTLAIFILLGTIIYLAIQKLLGFNYKKAWKILT